MAIGGTVVAPPVAEGADLVQISSSIHRLPSQIWAVRRSARSSAARQAAGHHPPGTLTDFSARLALRQAALKPAEDVILATLNDVPSILAGLIADATDAGVLTDPYTFAASKQGLRCSPISDYPIEYAETAGRQRRLTCARTGRCSSVS